MKKTQYVGPGEQPGLPNDSQAEFHMRYSYHNRLKPLDIWTFGKLSGIYAFPFIIENHFGKVL